MRRVIKSFVIIEIDAAAGSVGAQEQREAAIAVCLTERYRGLALLVRSYREYI